MKQKTVYERSHKNGPLPLRQSPSWQGWGGWGGGVLIQLNDVVVIVVGGGNRRLCPWTLDSGFPGVCVRVLPLGGGPPSGCRAGRSLFLRVRVNNHHLPFLCWS